MRKANKKSFDWYGMRQHFSIRKYHFGAASVLLGMSLALGAGAQVTQAEETVASSEATTATIASSTDSSAGSEAVVTEATVASTTETSVSAAETATSTSTETVASTTETVTSTTESSATTERTATINYIVQYVLEDGTLVKADVKTTSVTTTEATATSTVEVTPELPLGYELATGQAETVSQEVTENGENIVTVKVVKKAEEKAATSETTTTSTSSATTTATEAATTPTTATDTETVKTPATVEEAKVVLEQVTSEAEVLANEAERLVAASDSNNTALKAAAAATKLTATEATAVLNDSAATLEEVNAQIDAVRTNVEAFVVELRKYLGTDAIEIVLNNTFSDLQVGEGLGVLVEASTTATPSMDDPNGAGIKPHTLRTGVAATTEAGWYTFDSYDLMSYNRNMEGSLFNGAPVDAYMRFSLNSDPTTNTILAELVSKTSGQVLESHTVDPNTSSLFTYPKTIDTDNENILMRYETQTAVNGSTYGNLRFIGDKTGTIYNNTIIPIYQINTTTYKVEDGRILATYNLQTIGGQTVTSSGQRDFAGYEFVEKLVEPAQGGYPVGTKYVAGRVNTATDGTNTIQYKVVRTIVSNTEYIHEIFVLDPNYTQTVDWDGLDNRGFIKLLTTSHLSYTPDRVTYDYNTNGTIEANYTVDPETGYMVFAESAENAQGSKYRVVAKWSGNESTKGLYGRIFIGSQAWTKANTGADTPFAWQSVGGTHVDLGYKPYGIQQTLRGASTPAALTTTYVYRAVDQEAIIRYQVEGATDYLEESAIQTGGSGTEINYSTQDTIDKYKKLGYELVSDNFTTTDGQNYDTDTAVRQEFLVVIKPRIEEVPNTAVPGQPVDPTDPNSPVWPDSINNLETTQEVTRTTEYKYEDGTPVRVDATGNILPKDSTEGTPLVKTETVTFTRPAQVNLATGEVTYGEWAADSTDVLNGNLIPEITDYTATRTTLEGADAPMTESVTDKTVAATDADINEVVFYTPYGDVVVNYVNTDGKVIATPVVDTNDALVGTDYSTADQVPAKIVEDATGDVYYYKEVKAGDNETGKVVEGTTEVTYIYEKAGNVVVHYELEDGTPLLDPVKDVENGKPGDKDNPADDYTTTDQIKETITTADGKVYKRVPEKTKGNETGDVEAGQTIDVTYIYEEVKSDVVVEYYDTDGNPISGTETGGKTSVVDTDNASVGTAYDTDDKKPAKITTADGTVYYYKEEKGTSAPTTGKVAETTTTVQYVYEKAGNVVVNYITEDGTVIKDPVKDEENAEPGKTYSTEDNKPTTITTKDGKTYELIPAATRGNETGDVEAGKTTEVTYVYKEVKGSVVVNYVDENGNPISGVTDAGKETASTVEDTPETSTGTKYDTTDLRPNTITTADGKTYKLVPKLTQGSETGEVVPGVTQVTYVYEEVKGDVVVEYYDTEGNLISGLSDKGEAVDTKEVDTVPSSTGTAYNTDEDHKPNTITTADGTVYYYQKVKDTSASTTGKVVEGTTTVQYVYEKAGNVVVNYTLADGTVIKDPVNDETNQEPGFDYNTKDNKPETITTTDGKVYKLVPAATIGNETGDVEAGKTIEVTYIYEEVKSDVVVEYYNTAGDVIAKTVVDEDDKSVGTVYNTDEDNRPETITTDDGTVYYYKEVKDSSAPTTGKVAETTTTVQYVYEQAGNVVVNYITEDGTVIKSPVKDEENAEPGKTYSTEDNKPTTITTENGKTYELIPAATIGTEEGTVEAGKTTEVTYVYKEVKGSVVVNYVTTDGKVLQAPVTDTPETSTGTDYDTKDNKPTTITTADGKTYKLVPTLTKGSETGDVVPGVTQVTYVYEEVKGDVVVNYVNTDGKVIASQVVDTKTTSTGTAYDTTDNKPAKITAEDGTVYYYKEVDATSATETGKVVEGTTEITYVYEQAGNVVVNYITEDGTVIKSPVNDETNAAPGSGYNTTDNKPTTITTEDGTTYELVPSATIGTENGEVESGKTTEVTYVYRKVETPTPVAKTGNVVVEYYNTAGEKIASDVVDTPETTTGTVYETFDFKPASITKDGVTYFYKEVKDTSAAEKGTVVEGTTTVQYVYEPAGSVTVNYVTTDGTVIKSPVKDEENAEPGKTYTTEDNKPTTITTEDGKTYKLVPSSTTGEENGSVTSGEDKQVTYVYEEVKGDVVVNYIDTEGNVIKAPVTDTPSTSTGTSYDTTDNKPTTITTEDGTEYKLVPVLTKGEENGSVVEGTTQVTYVYQKVTTPAPKPNGSVVVNYVNTNGETIATSVNDTTDAALDTTYDTTDFKPAVIKHNGVTYFYKEVKAGDNESGKVVEGTTEVTYVYEPAGSVTVNYVTTNGTVIKSPVKDEENAEPGKTYTTEDNKPSTITTEDGKTYKLVPSLTTGEEKGSVTPGEDKQVTYVYEEVKGNVVVNYIDTEGNVIAARVEDTSSTSTGTSYDTTDNKPTTITTADGSVYELVPVLTQGNENGSVVEGTTEVTYVYRKVSSAVKSPVTNHVDENGKSISPQEDGTKPNTSIPGYEFTGKTTTDEDGNVTHVYRKVSPKGTVVVNYVTEDGTVISKPVTDTPSSDVDTPYNTTDNKPGTITFNGEEYELVRVDGTENGKVVEGETVVTYVYRKVTPAKKVVTNHVDEEGNVISPQEDGTTPDKSIPGYEFTGKTTTDENGNTTHVYRKVTPAKKVVTNHVDEEGNVISPQEDGTTPNKSIPGYEFTGKTITDENGNTTHVYRKKVNVVITYVDTNGVELKASVVDTEGAADGTAYNTKQNDNEYPLYIVKGDAVYKRVLAGDFTVGQTTEDGHLVSSDAVDGAVAAGTKVVTYVYELVTPAKTVVTNHVDEEGNVISPKEDGTKPNTSIPGYEFTGKTTVDEDGNVTHVYRKVKAVVTKHVDEDGNVISPQEDGTTPDKSIPGYEFTGKTITDENGNTTHVYRKVKAVVTNHVDEEGNVISPQEDGTTPDKSIPGYEFTGKTITLPNGDTLHIYRKVTTPVTPEPGRPGTPVTPEPGRPGTPVTPAPGKPATPAPAKPATPATPVSGKAQLPNTGEASSSASILGASMLVAALALVGKRRRNNED